MISLTPHKIYSDELKEAPFNVKLFYLSDANMANFLISAQHVSTYGRIFLVAT